VFIDEQITNLTRRIKSIEANPRPEYLKSNKLRYELELDGMLAVQESWKAGKPFGILMACEGLTHPLGMEHQGYIEWGDRVRNPQRYYDIAVSKLGFPDHTCDRTMVALGLLLSGEVPMPKLIVSRRVPCDPERWSSMAAAKYSGTLFYDLSRLNSNGDENIKCIADQLGDLIEFAEKSIAGVKYHEDQLIELLELDHQAHELMKETYELRKKVPCPISPQDSFRVMRMPHRFPNPAKVVEYCKMFHDEMFERAEKGIGGVKEEKLRIAWLATGPYGRSTFDMLNKKGIGLPWFHYGVASYNFGLLRNDYGDDTIYGRKLSPLEEVARHFNSNTWAGEANLWTDSLVQVCIELKIDAVVDFLQVGCVPTKNLKRITAQILRDELGIPTLDLEGREFFSTEASTNEMNRKLEEFLDMCIAKKQGH
jgi:hypothetical protein